MNILGIEFDRVTLAHACSACLRWAVERRSNSGGGTRIVVTPNPEMVMKARRDPLLREAIRGSDMALPDGVGVILASRMLGDPLPERVTGVDLMEELLKAAAKDASRVFFLGGRPGVAKRAAEKARERFGPIRVAGHYHGYFSQEEERSVVEMIRAAGPDFLFVGMGTPRQEIFMTANRKALGAGVAIGVGGALDALSGAVRRAPLLARRLGFEWLYRLVREPWRWRRQLSLLQFGMMVVVEAAKSRWKKGGSKRDRGGSLASSAKSV